MTAQTTPTTTAQLLTVCPMSLLEEEEEDIEKNAPSAILERPRCQLRENVCYLAEKTNLMSLPG